MNYRINLSIVLFIISLIVFGVIAYAKDTPKTPQFKSEIEFGQIPVRFEENKGQFPRHIKYALKSSRYTAFVTRKGLMVANQRIKQNPIDIEFYGSSDQIATGVEMVSGKVNYMMGNDKEKWIKDIPLYKEVTAKNVYSNIDVRYYKKGELLEYDFVVQPGGDVNDILLDVKNADSLKINNKGSLEMKSGKQKLFQHKPVIYQMVNNKKVMVEGRYEFVANRAVRFKTKKYDKSRPLIIDPVLEFSTLLGGEQSEMITDVEVDSTGIYVTGNTDSLFFPTTNPIQSTNAGGANDLFVTKLSLDGSSIIYSTYLGGSGEEGTGLYVGVDGETPAPGLAVNSIGQVYLTGSTNSSSDFPIVNAYQSIFNGGPTNPLDNTDGFLTKLNTAGNAIEFSTFIGGEDYDYLYDVALDSTENPVIVGHSISDTVDFPTTPGVIQENKPGGYDDDGVVAKFSATGSLIFSTYLGGNNHDHLYDIELDAQDNIYVVGKTNSTNTLPISNAAQASRAGGYDMYIAKLNSTATSLEMGTYWGGTKKDIGRGITVDSTGKIIVVGDTNSNNFPTQSPYQPARGGGRDAVVVKMSGAGVVDFSTYLGGTNLEYGWKVDTDNQDRLFVTGMTKSNNFPSVAPMTALFIANQAGGGDAYLTQFTADGSTVPFSSRLGGIDLEHGWALHISPLDDMYIAGITASQDYPTTPAALQTSQAVFDAFLIKLASDNPVGAAPDIDITSPANNSLLNDSTPTIALSFTDNGSGVDINTIEVTVDSVLIATTCSGTSASATCTPDSAISDGNVVIAASVEDTTGLRSLEDQVSITIDTILPIVTITNPVGGSITNQSDYTVDGSVNEAVQSLTVNGSSVTPDVAGLYTQIVTLTEGANTITVIATDLAGNQSTVTSEVTLETAGADIPFTPLVQLIFFSGPENGTVTVTGTFGSVEPGSIILITNDQTGATTTVTASSDGSFSAQLTGSVGDTFSIQAQNSAGASDVTVMSVSSPVEVTINSPANNSTVASDDIIVSGTTNAPINTGITVNGVPAAITGTPGNYQFTARVPVELGTNTITASAISFNNVLGQEAVTVMSTQELPFSIEARNVQGISPLEVEFITRTKANTKIQRMDFDFDNNGIIDSSSFNYSVPVLHTYLHTDTVLTGVTVTTDTGAIFTTSIPVTINNTADMDAVTEAVWSNFTTSINGGDLDTALSSFTPSAQGRYREIFEQLGAELSTIISEFSALQPSDTVSLNVATYTVNRTINGDVKTYPIYFIRNSMGVWRIDTM